MNSAGRLSHRSTVSKRQILFFDDFKGTAGQAVNSSLWTQDTGRYSADQGGKDYCTSGTNNVRLDGNGNLEIRVIKEVPPDSAGAPNNFTSGRITTLNKARFTPPFRAEAKIKLPTAQGLLPSFWTCGLQPGTWNEDWPKYGEIDVVELEGGVSDSDADNYVHMGSIADNTVDNPLGVVSPIGAAANLDYHIYAIDVHADSIRFHIDGQTKWTITQSEAIAQGSTWPFDVSPQFLIFTVYVAPDWMPQVDPSQTWPQSMLVDWVQVTSL